jgi:hypothetical protein
MWTPCEKRGWQRALVVLAGLMLLNAGGCGGRQLPPAVTMRGSVTLGGKPLEAGIVSLEPLDVAGASPVGLAVERGAFPVTVVPLGRYRAVLVSSEAGKPMTADNSILPADNPSPPVAPPPRVTTEISVTQRTTTIEIAFSAK